MLGVYTGTAVNALTLLAEGFDISVIGSQPAIFNAAAALLTMCRWMATPTTASRTASSC